MTDWLLTWKYEDNIFDSMQYGDENLYQMIAYLVSQDVRSFRAEEM